MAKETEPVKPGGTAAATTATPEVAASENDVSSHRGPSQAVPSAMSKKRNRDRQDDVHVHWDEELLAEQDKERGKCRKIEEPKTPWARSPVSSDDEAEVGTGTIAEDQGEVDPASVLLLGDGDPQSPPEPSAGAGPAAGRPTIDGDHLAARLHEVAGTKDAVASDGAAGLPPAQEPELRVTMVLPEGAEQPKASSAEFKAKRARHYNEFQAVLAFRKQQAAAKSDSESDA